MSRSNVTKPGFIGPAEDRNSFKRGLGCKPTEAIRLLRLLILGAFLPLFLLTACCGVETVHRDKAISMSDALEIASSEFEKMEYGHIEEFTIDISDEYNPSEWHFFFEPKRKFWKMGQHFMISVNKSTGEVRSRRGE
jgi:hypothetical protein